MTTAAPHRCYWCDSIDSPECYGCDICWPSMTTLCDEEPEMQTQKAPFATYTHYPRIDSGIVSMKVLPAGWVAAKASDQAEADRKASKLLKSLEDACALPGVLTSGTIPEHPKAFLWLTNLKGPISLDHFLKPPSFPDWIVKPWSVPVVYIPVIGLDLVIVSGGWTPLHPGWVRQIRDECRKAGVAFVFAGWGNFVPTGEYSGTLGRSSPRFYWSSREEKWTVDRIKGDAWPEMNLVGHNECPSGRTLDGTTHDRYPEGL